MALISTAKRSTDGTACHHRPAAWTRQMLSAAVVCAIAFAAPAALAGPTGIGLSGVPSGLDGTGVNVAQVEANVSPTPTTTDQFEVNPSVVNQLASKFTYINGSMPAGGTFTAAEESSHADTVGNNFYGGNSAGVAPGVSSIDNYDAGYFENNVLGTYSGNPIVPMPILNKAAVVNQSFINEYQTNPNISASANKAAQLQQQTQIDAEYDNYTNTYNTIFVSAIGDGATTITSGGNTYNIYGVNPPATAYNSIAVAAYPSVAGATGAGPTNDGRDKPDITAPGGATSYTTPLVSGAAAILVQAGTANDGGAGTALLATKEQTVKALLLNGAVKPTGYTATDTQPLDYRYGSGLLNIGNSYKNLAAGQHAFSAATASQTPDAISTGTTTEGWDYSAIGAPGSTNVNHYVFALPSAADTAYKLTTTLVWNAQTVASASAGTVSIAESLNHLMLYLYNATTGSTGLVADSISNVDNVQQIYIPTASLIAGDTYDLQVVNNGGGTNPTDNYALAWNFQGVPAAVPEPATLGLLTIGAVGLLARRRKVAA